MNRYVHYPPIIVVVVIIISFIITLSFLSFPFCLLVEIYVKKRYILGYIIFSEKSAFFLKVDLAC